MRFLGIGLLAAVVVSSGAMADGTETLGPPGIAIAAGSGVVVAGTGLFEGQPQSIDFDIPMDASIVQVLLYWEGQMETNVLGDDVIVVDNGDGAQVVAGVPIGGPAFFFNASYSSAFRADVTGLGLVTPGANSLAVQGVTFTRVANGAGVLVILDDGLAAAELEVRDGADLAFFDFPEPRKSTVPQTFAFAPAPIDRTAELSMLFSSVAGTASTRGFIRPNVIEIEVGGQRTKIVNALASLDGEEWDSLTVSVEIPADADQLTVQAISPDDVGIDPLPASMTWIGAALALPPATGCRMTGGGNDTAGAAADESWDGTMAEVSPRGNRSRHENRYQFGGQAGARTAQQPQPRGEWTHHQQRGPDGRFVFHGGTSSAPPGTDVDRIVCSDPGNCQPAREAPSKQLDFDGVGTFKNIKKPSGPLSNVVVGETYHWFRVHVEDLGEPGSGNQTPDPAICPPQGRDGLGGELADCACPDFYRITIYEGVIPVFDDQGQVVNLNKIDVIYEVMGYLDGGNLQIHPVTGFDQH